MYYTKDDVELYYDVVGTGKPILMLHGCAPDHELLKGCMGPCLINKEYKRIYLDLPGMGQSNAPKSINNSDDILKVLLSFVKEIIQDEHFLLVGQSFGGYLSRAILLNFKPQVDGMMLLCPVAVPLWSQRTCPEPRVIVKDELFLDSLAEIDRTQFESGAVVQTKQVYDRYKAQIEVGLKRTNTEFVENFQHSYTISGDIDNPSIAKFDKPVLFILGRFDSCVGYKDHLTLLDNYSRATLAILDSAGHNAQIENPILFKALVEDWLARI